MLGDLDFMNSNLRSKVLGVGIAGLGFGEAVHLPAINSNPSIDASVLWHPRSERLEEACKKNNLLGHTKWKELLADKNIEGVIIATPPGPRFELAKQALEAQKHLLLEKPVALNCEQIAELQRIAIKNNLSVAVDFEYRAVPLFMQTKRLLTQRVVGDPWLVKFDWLMGSRANALRPWNWYSQVSEGGGVLGALGTHAIDILHWFFGPTKNLNGLISTSIKERLNPLTGQNEKVTSEDVALSHLQLLNEETNSLIPVQLTLSAVAREGRGCWLEIYGSEGTLLLGSNNLKDYVHGFGLWLTKAGGKVENIFPDEDLHFDKTWSDGRIAPVARLQSWWAESIRKSNPVIPGLREALTSQKVCESIKESSTNSQRIFIG